MNEESAVWKTSLALIFKPSGIRLMWIFFICGSLTLFGYHLSTLVQRYEAEPVNVIDSPNGKPFEFPDIHICPQIPFSPSAVRILNENSSPQWTSIWKDMVEIEDTVNNLSDNLTNFESIQMKIRALWETIGAERMLNIITLPAYESILSFKVNNVDLNYTLFKVTPHWKYFFCFSYYPNATTTVSVDTIQFTDSSNFMARDAFDKVKFAGVPLQAIPFHGDTDVTKSGGVVVYATPRGQYPSEDAGAAKIIIGTGSESIINIKQQIFTALSTKSRPCLSAHPSVSYSNFLRSGTSVTYKYSKWTCISSWRSLRFIEDCGCAVHELPVDPKLNVSHCLDFKLYWSGKISLQQLESRYKCVIRTMETTDVSLGQDSSCRTNESLCSTSKYSSQVFNSLWLLTGLSKEMVDKYILTRTKQLDMNGMSYHALEQILESANEIINNSRGNIVIYDTGLVLLFKENFLCLRLNRAAYTSSDSYESLSYPLPSLISDMGGILGMYIGVSILSICELIEFVLRIFKVIGLSKAKNKIEMERSTNQKTETTNSFISRIETSQWPQKRRTSELPTD